MSCPARLSAFFGVGRFTRLDPFRPFRFFRPFRLSLALTLACAGPRQRLRGDTGPSPLADGFELTLNNRHWLDINVFVQHDGEASRVTTVTASSSQSLILPLWLLGDSKLVRFIAEPVGEQGSYTTDLLRVEAGQFVELNVESVLSRSNYSVQ
jgi:hypothetical protein